MTRDAPIDRDESSAGETSDEALHELFSAASMAVSFVSPFVVGVVLGLVMLDDSKDRDGFLVLMASVGMG